MIEHGHQAARHRIARGVVAADDQQAERADELGQRHVLRGLAVGHHRDQVELGRLGGTLLPQRRHDLGHLHQFRRPLGFTAHNGILVLDIGDGDIGPMGELAPVLLGKVEQRRQHHGRQLGRHEIDPVERLVARQAIEHPRRALADQPLHVREVGGRHDRRHGLALRRVARRIHADETWPLRSLRLICDLDAAQLLRRRIGPVIELDLHDVGVARDRPIRSERALGMEMHRILATQPRKVGTPVIVAIEPRLADVDISVRYWCVHSGPRLRFYGRGSIHHPARRPQDRPKSSAFVATTSHLVR